MLKSVVLTETASAEVSGTNRLNAEVSGTNRDCEC